jgi:uncharacterized cupin superfamily protein
MQKQSTDAAPTAANISGPSYVDLRRFAVDDSLGFAMPSGASPTEQGAYFGGRRYLRSDEQAVRISAVSLASGEGVVAEQPFDEFVIVCEGRIELHGDVGDLVLENGNSVIVKKGCAFRWRVQDSAVLIFMGYRNSSAGDKTIVPIRTDVALSPSNPPSAALLIGATPTCSSHVAYQSEDQVFICGVWESTPYQRRAMAYKYYELMYLLEGSVTFEDHAGNRGTFSKGDIFVIEQKAQCAWVSTERVAKVFAVAQS